MNLPLIISISILSILFVLYKFTYFFNKKRHKIFQYFSIIFLFSLSLFDIVIGNMMMKETGFSFLVGLYFFVAMLVSFSGSKVLELLHDADITN